MCFEAEYMMHLFACASTGKHADPPSQDIDWDCLVRLAREQSVIHFVAVAIKKNSHIPVPERIKSELLTALTGTALRNKLRCEAILKLIEEMNNSGIQVLLLKGISAARLYQNPECRESADTDILIHPEQEEKVLNFIRREGFSVKPRLPQMHHASATHPTYGMFEIHVSLWEEDTDSLMFNSSLLNNIGTFDNAMQVDTVDGKFFTLGEYEGLLFLTMHMMKHFIYSGISLRMLMDVCLYYRQTKQTDRDKFWQTLKEFNFERTISAIFKIATEYCGFSQSDFIQADECRMGDVDKILEDMLSGGWNGAMQSDGRFLGWAEYRMKKNTQRYGKIHALRIRFGEVKPYLFPCLQELSTEYPVLKKQKWLYPFVCVVRIIKKAVKRLSKKPVNQELAEINEANRRTKMLQELNLM